MEETSVFLEDERGQAGFSFSAENSDLKARLERMIRERPYLAASLAPVLSKVEGPVQ